MVQTFKLAILTVLIAVPLGTLFAIGIDRWHGRPARAANFTMLLSFVVPEIILGVSLYILFTNLLAGIVTLGTHGAAPRADRLPAQLPVRSSCAHGCCRSARSTRKPRWISARRRARRSDASCCRCSRRRSWRASRWSSPTCVDDFVTVAALSGPAEQRDARAEDLLGGPFLTDARGQRRGHDDADHDAAGDRRRPALLQAGQPRSGQRRRRRSSCSCSGGERARLSYFSSSETSSSASSRTAVPPSGSTRSASRGKCTVTASPERCGSPRARVGRPRLDRLAGRQVQDHLQHRADVDGALDHRGQPVLAGRALRLDLDALGADRDLAVCRRCRRRPRRPPAGTRRP